MADDSAATRSEALVLLEKVRGFVALPGQSWADDDIRELTDFLRDWSGAAMVDLSAGAIEAADFVERLHAELARGHFGLLGDLIERSNQFGGAHGAEACDARDPNTGDSCGQCGGCRGWERVCDHVNALFPGSIADRSRGVEIMGTLFLVRYRKGRPKKGEPTKEKLLAELRDLLGVERAPRKAADALMHSRRRRAKRQP